MGSVLGCDDRCVYDLRHPAKEEVRKRIKSMTSGDTAADVRARDSLFLIFKKEDGSYGAW
jgi:hypothetical protein